MLRDKVEWHRLPICVSLIFHHYVTDFVIHYHHEDYASFLVN